MSSTLYITPGYETHTGPNPLGVQFRGLNCVKSHDEMRMKLSPTATSLEHLKAYLNWLT